MHKSIQLLFVGRLEEQKGIYELMNAYKQLKQDFPHIHLTIIGRGSLERMVRTYGLLPKTVSYSQMPKVFHQADIFILPSKPDKYWEEYFGMVLLEAMASRLPIVSTQSGGIPEVLGKAAMLVKPGSSSAIYDGVRFLLEKPQWREKLAQRGYERVKKDFDCTKQSQKLKELYLSLDSK